LKKQKSIDLLNKAVADELHAVHQYMYFHFHLDDLGYGPLATLMKRIAIEEMGHIEKLAERVLFLGGDVIMEAGGKVDPIREPRAMLDRAREMEVQSAEEYNEWALECSNNADSVSKQIFEGLVADEERHSDIFDQEVERLGKFGEQYLALQSFGRAGTAEGE
jgi:bacterioferritin